MASHLRRRLRDPGSATPPGMTSSRRWAPGSFPSCPPVSRSEDRGPSRKQSEPHLLAAPAEAPLGESPWVPACAETTRERRFPPPPAGEVSAKRTEGGCSSAAPSASSRVSPGSSPGSPGMTPLKTWPTGMVHRHSRPRLVPPCHPGICAANIREPAMAGHLRRRLRDPGSATPSGMTALGIWAPGSGPSAPSCTRPAHPAFLKFSCQGFQGA